MNAPFVMRPQVVPAEPVSPSSRAGTFWTDERVEALKRMHADGLSASAMSREFGGAVTRHAVLGKLWRLGLADPKPRNVAAALAHKRQRERTAYLARRKAQAAAAPKPAPLPVPAPSPEPDPLPPPQRGPIAHGAVEAVMALRSHDCRFPIGDVRERSFRFCGSPRASETSSYCAHHRAIATPPSPPRVFRR